MVSHGEQDHAIRSIAAELGRIRQRGLVYLDRRSHNQQPIAAGQITRYAGIYTETKGLDLHGRIAQIAVFLLDALRAYGERGYQSESQLIHDLFFAHGQDSLTRLTAEELLDQCRQRHGPDDAERFKRHRREALDAFAAFLVRFMPSSVVHSGSSVEFTEGKTLQDLLPNDLNAVSDGDSIMNEPYLKFNGPTPEPTKMSKCGVQNVGHIGLCWPHL